MPTPSRVPRPTLAASSTPAAPWFREKERIGSANVSTADWGPSLVTASVSTRVSVSGSTTSPTSATMASSAGKTESTA